MALDIISTINLDLKRPNTETVYAVQYDTAGRIKAQLTNDGEAWHVPTSAGGMVSFRKSDNIGGFYDTTELGEVAVSVDENDDSVIYIALDAQTTVTATPLDHPVQMQINFYNSQGKRLSTFAFYLRVQASVLFDGDQDERPVASEWTFRILTGALGQTIKNQEDAIKWMADNIRTQAGYVVDDTLKVPGAAGDAKKIGELFEEIVKISDSMPGYFPTTDTARVGSTKYYTRSGTAPNYVYTEFTGATFATGVTYYEYSPWNRIWIDPDDNDVAIPTMDEFDELKSAVTNIEEILEVPDDLTETKTVSGEVVFFDNIDLAIGDSFTATIPAPLDVAVYLRVYDENDTRVVNQTIAAGSTSKGYAIVANYPNAKIAAYITTTKSSSVTISVTKANPDQNTIERIDAQIDDITDDIENINLELYGVTERNFEDGKALNYSDGTLTDDATACTSEFIPITWTGYARFYCCTSGVNKYTYSVCMYNSSKQFINAFRIPATNGSTYRSLDFDSQVDPNARYVRFDFKATEPGKVMDIDGGTNYWVPVTNVTGGIVPKVEEMSAVLDDLDEATKQIIDDAYLDYSESARYNADDAIVGKYVNPSGGGLRDNATEFTTDYLSIRPNETLYSLRVGSMQAKKIDYWAGYDENKVYVPGSGGSNVYNVTQSGTVAFVRMSFAYQSDYYTSRPEGIFIVPTDKPWYCQQINADPVFDGDYLPRKTIYVYATDTEQQVIEKFVNAYMRGNCDLQFERAHYSFGTVLPNIKALYKLNENEIPIGNNCRYYFNGATLEADIDLSTLGIDFYCNLLGSQRFPSSYELYDGILISTDTRYVVHDEASGYTATYRRVYRNMEMHYITRLRTDRYRKCIGGGTGKNGAVDIDGCVFTVEGEGLVQDVSYHGCSPDVPGSEFYISVKNSWFSQTFSESTLGDTQTAKVHLSGNSFGRAIIEYPRWTKTYFLNEIRS